MVGRDGRKTMNKHELMYKRIDEHGRTVATIFGLKKDPVKLAKQLLRLENYAHKLAEDYCNGKIHMDTMNKGEKTIERRLLAIIGKTSVPVIFNHDPRGYALKIESDWVREHDCRIHRDMGGYGILAPDFRE